MKILIALRDTKVGSFLPPMVASTPGEAERTYQRVLRQEGTMVHDYPHDFPLYEIGRYDEETGQVFGLINEDGSKAPPRLLLEAAQLLQLQKEA